MNKWHVVTDCNPKKKNLYLVILIWPEWSRTAVPEETGVKHACIEARMFTPENGWDEPIGSILGEQVYAWLEVEDVPMPQIPDGIIWHE